MGETRHPSLESATIEALRLAKKECQQVTILQAVGVVALPPDTPFHVYKLQEAEPLWPDEQPCELDSGAPPEPKPTIKEEVLESTLVKKPFIEDTYENRKQIKCNDLGFAYECLLSNGEVVKATFVNYQRLGWCYAGTFSPVKPDVVGFNPTNEEATSDDN
jgi:hypothetical protein